MPNYRKYRQAQKNKRNKNKNKNSPQQNKNESNAESSSSAKRELSGDDECESVGTEPSVVGGGVNSPEGNGVIDDSSPSSNEEIDENACNVDTAACGSDCSKTVLTKSSFSSSSRESTEIERISRRLVFGGDSSVEASAVIRDSFDGASTINSPKTGTPHSKDAVVSTAATSTSKSEKKSEAWQGNEDLPQSSPTSRVLLHRTVEETTERTEERDPDHNATTKKLIVHQILKEPPCPGTTSNVTGSKVFVHKVEESRTTSHTALKTETLQSTRTEQTSKKKAVRSTTKEIEQAANRVIVHQISREDDSGAQSPKEDAEQSSKVIVHQISKENDESQSETSKVIVQQDPSDKTQSVAQQASKVIVHQVNENEEKSRTASVIEKTSKVIVHQISTENKESSRSKLETSDKTDHPVSRDCGSVTNAEPSSRVQSSEAPMEQASKVIIHQISTKNVEIPNSPKETVHQPGREDKESHQVSREKMSQLIKDATETVTFSRDLPTEEVKVIAHQITLEDASQVADDSLKDVVAVDETSRRIYHQSESQGVHQSTDRSSRTVQNPIPLAGETPKVFIIPISVDNSFQSPFSLPPKPNTETLHRVSESSSERSPSQGTTHSFPVTFPVQEEPQPLDVVFERISRSRSPEPEKFIQEQENLPNNKIIVHPILQDKETQMSPPDSPEIKSEHTILTNGLGSHVHPQTEPLQKTSFPMYRSPKVIVHQIHHEGYVKPAFPLTANSMEKLNDSSKQIACKILQDVSSELKTTFASETRGRTAKDTTSEPIRTSFPFTLRDGPLRTSFTDFSALLDESPKAASSSSPKVIVHPILRQEESEPEAGDSKLTTDEILKDKIKQTESVTESSQKNAESKVIVHEISKVDQATSESDSKQKTVTQTISKDEGASLPESPGSKVIVHKIVREDSDSKKFPSQAATTSDTSFTSHGFPQANVQPTPAPALSDLEEKLRVFKTLQEELKLAAQLQQRVESNLGIQSNNVAPHSFPVLTTKGFPTLLSKDDSSPKLPLTPEESTSSSSSSGDTILTAVRLQSPNPISPSDSGEQQPSTPVKNQSPRSSFFLTSLELSQPTTPPRTDTPDLSDTETLHGESDIPADEPLHNKDSLKVDQLPRADIPKEPTKVIIHPILREMTTEKPLAYRVESPQPEHRLAIVKKSKSFDDDDVVIQEMSDTSSAGDTDNPPVVSEAESETDTLEAIDDFPETPLSSRVLSVQTLPIDHEDENQSQLSPKSSQNYKARRQQNRVALESHFLPQFLSPIYLDSIKEENSDLSDSERRSECSDRADHPPSQADLEDDVFHDDGPHAKKADAVFPKSNLDFSKKHIHVHTNVRPPKTTAIREEAPPPSVVEAKIIDQGSVEESCSTWSTDLTPESEAAEVVYIDSASSSVSDLLELDYSQGQPHDAEDSLDVRIQTPTIDLESINEMFLSRPHTERAEPPPPPPSPTLPPVEESENMAEKIPSPPPTAFAGEPATIATLSETESTTTTPSTVERTISNEIILEKIESMSDTVSARGDDGDRDRDDDRAAAAAASDRTQNSKADNPNSCDSAINEVVANATSDSAAVGRSEKMESIREIVCSAVESDLGAAVDQVMSKPDFKIGEPCSDHTLKCDITNTSSTSPSSTSSSTTTTTTATTTSSSSVTKITTTSGTQILTLHDLRMNLGDTQHLHPLGGGSSALDRQESLDSHGSDQSQSTNQSQCTAINQGSLPNCEWNEFDTTTDTTYVSGSDTAGLASSENSSPITTGSNKQPAKTESPPIKKLRSLCTEALASMPYGEEVLEELATVAKNIGDMPYPLPQIPHIHDIQLSLRSGRSEPQPPSSSVITLTQVPPASTPNAGAQKLRSPPPPPVPEPPSKYDSWLGVPTQSDPNVLVCLSPSQRAAVNDTTTPDSLLDMHKKFVERRGYHEFTSKQVKAMNDEHVYETVTLRKSSSPPPLPPRPEHSSPPAPQPAQSNGNGTEVETDIFADDQNNHRLLAIIRDTQPHQHHEQQTTTTATSENISRRTESHNNTSTAAAATTPTAGEGGRQEESANQPSVSKQTQERFVSERNQSKSAREKMQTEHTIKVESEPVMGLRFPTNDYFDSIFSNSGTAGNKRFSNIETGPSPSFCSQFRNSQPKRYSNIETSSFESRKCVENGKVMYDVTDRAHEKRVEGEKPDSMPSPTSFPHLMTTSADGGFNIFPHNTGFVAKTDSRTQQPSDTENIMSAFKLKTQTEAAASPAPPRPPPSTARVEASPPAPPVPPLPTNLAEATATTASTTKSTSTAESVINRNFNAETKETIRDDFRQRAKEPAGERQSTGATTTTTTTSKSSHFDHEKVFKDFDELSKLLKDELESGKRRPPATLDTTQIPASVSDYNRVAAESRIQSNRVTSSTSEQTRREQMKKLADEIDRTATQRQRQRQAMRIPIRVEKPTPTPPKYQPDPAATSYEQTTRSTDNLKKWSHEADRVSQRTYEIPIQIEKEARPRLQNQRSYEIPVHVEPQTEARQRTFSERRPSNEAPSRTVERTREESQRFRRAESMFNISDTSPQRHMLHDDWMKYVGDLGSSENICKPFQREVEICYLGRRPNIRAPRLSASTSDLSSSQCYDTYGAYDVRRSAHNQTPRPQQPPRRYHSTQSMIDTTPITPCVSSRRSPVPERRSSLPRELHDQQLKYISSREQQLQLEFERLENERRQLIDEMNRAQINQRISREAYRQRQLPPLTEDESFRQQMAEEWLDKVAQREERRLQKIIKISKLNQDENFPAAPPRRTSASDIGDEFLRRVKERRSKLCMPSDSDWESGAESQPAPRADGNRSETEEPPVTILEGHSAADLKQLPKHLREFAKLTSQLKEEHREETTENSSCSAIKKSSVVTTVKATNSHHQTTKEPQPQPQSQSTQQDAAARARDLEQLSQGKRQKVVTILRNRKPTESGGSDGSCPTATGGATAAKRRKQTRFLLTPNRRSWSESDLLREIDKDLVLAKGFLYANGVWTPKNQTPSTSSTNLNEFQPQTSTAATTVNSSATSENRSSSACEHNQKGIPTPPPPPLWTPQPERKQFRPVHFESPVPQRRYVRQQSTPSEAAPPPWSYTNSKPFPGYQSQSCTNLSQRNTAVPWPPASLAQSGTPTADEGLSGDDNGFPASTSIAEKIRSFERSTSNSELHRPFVRHNPHEKPAILRPNEVIFSVKNEYMSEPETEYEKPKKMAQLSRRQYDGIGPTTNDGMPVVLRSEVKEPNQHEWYKRIFQTIHKQKNPDDYVTIRYKCPRGRYAYKANGYMSEPEPNYDSDYSTVKYRTLERRRLQSTGPAPEAAPSAAADETDTVYGTMPNPVKSGQGSYKVQPGRIEDYVTGHSSVSEKEKKEWWDEVMDIFNGWLKDNDPLPRVFIEFANEVEEFHLDQQKLSPHYTQGNLSRALLKEQGYTSDSNLVFRKKDAPQLQSPLSPVEQKQVYKSVQAGGQPPLLGFRKPAPEKPKETEFEYLPITSTLTKIRVHSKDAMSKKSQTTTHAAQRELICYPITNVSRPVDMFAPFPKHVPSFIPMNQPPLPPNRKSSRTRTTSMALKISASAVKRPTSANSSRHEACFRTKDDASAPPAARPTKYGTVTLRKTVKRSEPLVRSKSAGAVLTLLAAAKEEKSKDGRVSRVQQAVRLSSASPVRSASRLSTLRATSRSPVAFGRSVSKERSFAEEKKRIEETMPSIRTDFTASTNILRDPSLKSPDQVKRAVRSYACPMERSKSVPKALSLAKPTTPSYMLPRRVSSPSRSITRPCQTSTSTRSPTRTSVVVRSKSQSSRLSERTTSKAITKTSSTVSLARTSSTFSVDSTTSKAKPTPRRPTSVTRPSTTRTETEKAKRKPVTISSSKSDSNVLQKIKESSEAKKKIVKAIPSQQKAVRTNQFFTKLFMRDTSPKRVDGSVHERARYWNTMSLPPKATVCDETRYLAYDHFRSLSPPTRPHYVEEYETVEQFSDNEASEFGDVPGRTESLVWQYEQGSMMDSHSLRSVYDIARPESPAPSTARQFSPTREVRVPQSREMRSPSRRRIQSYRGNQRNGESGKVIRASSLSSADDRSKRSLYHCEDISHSANSLEYIERHSPSCRFKNSERFIDLNRFYSTLERVGQLERATSATSLKPIRKEGQPLDFEEWRRLRFHERAERELNYLVGRLKEEQKQGDFLFRPKDVDDIKWSGNKDLSLRSRDKSVEDLRENFEKKIHEEWLDESRRLELEAKKDTYKPYWRGSSVADLASSMEIKFNPDSGSFGVRKLANKEAAQDKPLCLSNRLISTLSKDQVSKITQQLNEIYNASEPKSKPDVTEEFVVTVDEHTPSNALKVRCNSTISKEELIEPVLRRKEASAKAPQSKATSRLSQEIRKLEDELSEGEKKRLSQTLCREIQGKARSGSPVMLARETRGAIAAEQAKVTLPDVPPPPPLPKPTEESKKTAPAKPKRKAIEEQKKTTPAEASEDAVKVETVSKETIEKPEDTVSKKIQYFEERKFEEPAKTIYHAREDSSPDEDEIMRVIEENIKARAEAGKYHHQELTSSTTDLKELFGEREASRINFPLPRPPPPPDETMYHETKQGQHRSTSLTLSASRDGSLEHLETLFRSRSISPEPPGSLPYLHRVNTGEVRKIKDKFESLGRPIKKKHFFALSPLRKVRSDPELNNEGSKDTFKTVVRENEIGDVSWITHKFEAQSAANRGRSRFRKPSSPIQRMPLRKDDRLMPHIDIISKTASLKQEMMKSRSPSPVRQPAGTLHVGEVERIRVMFETSPDREAPSQQSHLGTSSPELRDISTHLTASWIAHKYPKPVDNNLRSPPPLPEKQAAEQTMSLPTTEVKRPERTYRSRSISPPKAKRTTPVVSILKPRFDFFANQKFDPSIHRPKARYVPDAAGEDPSKKNPPTGVRKPTAVKFKDSDDAQPPPPVPPTKGVPLDSNGFSNLESPNRYFESDVNIHYKTPIRYENKEPIPEEELAIRQAELMQKLYQEERRRKYLQELQDMNSRRHTDNFTPSQKSPIPLNRYDDFNSDLAPKSPNSASYPKTVARALYNFQGQTARELTFKKGDVIYIRRQIDKNWYEGEHNAMIGLLPSNYVEILTKDGVRQPPKKPSEGQARAKYNFQAQSGIELSLNKGELVTLTRRVDENWFEGKIANRKGIFPVSYVEVLVDIGAEDKASRTPITQSTITQSSSVRPSLDTLRTNINNEFNSLTSNGQHPNGILKETRTLHKTEVLHVDTNTEPVAYRALYKYRPQNTDELELQEGDIVYVLEKCDDGWFVGTSQRSGCFGTFPGNYVERV